jgi:glyoxylate reductase
MTEKQTILLIGNLDHALAEWRALDAKFNLKHFSSGGRASFLKRCESGEFQDVVGLYRSNTSTSETGPFDAELINALPKKLKYICHNGAGYDNIDVAAATKRGIMISSTPVAVDNATADAAIFLMLGALRKAMIPLTALRSGQWRGSTPIGHDPEGKILGILGMGGIGRVSILQHHGNSLLPCSNPVPGRSPSSESFWYADHVSQSDKAFGRA